MGLYLSMYVGPYAEATATAVKRETDVYGCTSEKCPEWKRRDPWQGMKSPFCASCVSPTGKTTKMMVQRPSPYDALGGSERLEVLSDESDEDVHYFISNIRDSLGERLDGDKGANHHVDLSDVDREAEMKKFEELFHEELASLRKVYDVEVRWGFHADWS